MTMLSVPVCLSTPRNYLPPELEGYSCASHFQRAQPIGNGVAYCNPHGQHGDWGGGDEDFSVNILSHDGFPSVELALTAVPHSKMARRIEQCVRKARHTAVDQAMDGKRPSQGSTPSSSSAHGSSAEKVKPKRKPKAPICQVSVDVDQTLDMLLKLMPGKRLSDLQMRELAEVITKNHAAFAKDSKDYGRVSEKYNLHHSICTDNAEPKHQRPYRHSKFEEDFLKALVVELQVAGLIRASSSPWISPVVLVKKKDGGLRMCIDFRKLNAVTKRDPYQLPMIDSLINRMQGCQYFSNIDVLSAFWNVPMAEEDIEKTGFTTSFGNYEWLRMPFGLINASSTFQRLMDKVTSGLNSTAAYIDDVFVFSTSWEDHLQALDKTLSRLVEAGLKCKLSKCSFAGDSVKCLGQVVSRDGVTIDEDKLQAIRDLPRPNDATGVRSFVGFVNYFRQFIDKYAETCQPLHALTKKNAKWEWTDACEQAFLTLKAKLCEKPVLAMPDFSPGHQTFRLHTDWSKTAIGAVLLQKDASGQEHAIAYASRILSSAERNYAPTEGECLAVVWAVKKFRHYLHGRPFEILTDHYALKWLQEARFNNSKLERWALALQEHDYKIAHHSGKDNVIADCLSRVVAAALAVWENHYHASLCSAEVSLDELSKSEHADLIKCVLCNDPGGADNMAFCSGCNKPFHLRCHLPPMATVPIGDWYCLSCKTESGQLHELLDPETLLQYHPHDLYRNAELVHSLRHGLALMPGGPERRALKRSLRNARIHPLYKDWIQIRTTSIKEGGALWRSSPPVEYRWGVIRMYHDLLGHSGIEHTHRCLAKQVFWPNMKKDVAAFCLACLVCQQRKATVYDLDFSEKTVIHGALKHIHVDLAGPFKVTKVSKSVSFEGVVAAASPRRSPRQASASQPAHSQAASPPEEDEPLQHKASKPKQKMSTSTKSKPDPPEFSMHWVLLIIDYFTKAAELIAIPTKASEGVARMVWDHWFCRYGVPTYLTSDNGTEFQGAFAGMLERMGIVHITTAVRHPQSNGVCERLVGTFKRKLYSYCNGNPSQWLSYLPRLRYAYMQEVHGTTHYSPFEMVYGFTPSHPLPIKISLLEVSNPGEKSYLDLVMHRQVADAELCSHVEKLRHRHLQMDQEVLESIRDAQDRELTRFLHRKEKFHHSLPTLQAGDYVFEVNESPKPLQAVANGPYRVVSRHKDMAMLRTGVTKWDPHPREFPRKVDFLTPCLTKRQALAKAYGLVVESATREAPLKFLAPNALLEVTF